MIFWLLVYLILVYGDFHYILDHKLWYWSLSFELFMGHFPQNFRNISSLFGRKGGGGLHLKFLTYGFLFVLFFFSLSFNFSFSFFAWKAKIAHYGRACAIWGYKEIMFSVILSKQFYILCQVNLYKLINQSGKLLASHVLL